MTETHVAYRFLFIFTYGRSGSTLLMGYLNRLPNFCIRGENYNALFILTNFYNAMKSTKAQSGPKSGKPTHPWYGTDDVDLQTVRETIADTFVKTVLSPVDGAQVVGFKEIRVGWSEIDDFNAFLRDIMEIFGDVKILFNHRSIGDTSQSKWWKDSLNSYASILSMDQRLRTNSFADAENVFHVDYDNFIRSPEHARALTDFLGVPFDETVYNEVLATRHSY